MKTINRFQTVLHPNGTIEMSYDRVAAKDAIVGIYPLLTPGDERAVATLINEEHPETAPNLDVRKVRISVVDNLILKVSFATRGPIAPEGDPNVEGVAYTVSFDAEQPSRGKPIANRLTWAGPFVALATAKRKMLKAAIHDTWLSGRASGRTYRSLGISSPWKAFFPPHSERAAASK